MTTLPPGAVVQPIDTLNPFLAKWWIKARVTDKSDVRTWNKPQSQGKLFSFTLVDASSSIRCTAFNEAVDMIFPMIQSGNVYFFSGGQIKNANKRFTSVNNDYELSMDKNCQVIPAPRTDADSASIPVQRYNFVPISALKQRETGSLVDVLAVITNVSDLTQIVQKTTGTPLTKRTIHIADRTAAIELTLWNDQAKDFNVPRGTVIAIRSAKTGSFDGVTLSATFQSTFDINPSIPDTQKLHEWFTSTGGSDVASLSSTGVRGGDDSFENFKGRKFFEDIAAEGMGRGLKADFIDVRCVPVYLKTDSQFYEACPACQKKCSPLGPDPETCQFKCEKCDKVVVPIPRYLVSIQASDNLNQMWLTLFNEAGEQFFGMSAAALKERCRVDKNFITKIAQMRMHRPLLMRIRIKEERQTADSEDRMRCTVTKITELLLNDREDDKIKAPVGALAAECNHLVECINAYL